MREAIARHPATGAIFIQLGRLFRAERGHLYASYEPALTVGEFATRNHLDARHLLERLEAAVETEPSEPPAPSVEPEEGPAVVPYVETLYGVGRVVGPAD